MPDSIISPKVMVINFRPAAIPTNWNNSEDLSRQYVQTMRTISGGTLAYQVVIKKNVKDYPILEDGRRYTDQTWLQARQDDKTAYRDAYGNYMFANYSRIVQDFALLQLVRDFIIDEVWMFGGPYFGFYESRMIGKNAIWCNSPGLETTGRRFVIMGYNYERDVKEMVHNYGHRSESILGAKYNSLSYVNQLYGGQTPPPPANDFENFLHTYGTTHRPPGGADYSQDEIAWMTKFQADWFPPTADPNKIP